MRGATLELQNTKRPLGSTQTLSCKTQNERCADLELENSADERKCCCKTQQDFADLHSSELQRYTPKQLKNSATKRFSGKTISAASLVAAAQFTCFVPVCFVGF